MWWEQCTGSARLWETRYVCVLQVERLQKERERDWEVQRAQIIEDHERAWADEVTERRCSSFSACPKSRVDTCCPVAGRRQADARAER